MEFEGDLLAVEVDNENKKKKKYPWDPDSEDLCDNVEESSFDIKELIIIDHSG